MDFSFHCAHCAQTITARADQIGLAIPCPHCRTFVTVPSGPSAGAPLPPSAVAEKSSPLKSFVFIILGLLSALYLCNPTAGFFELIPDNFPLVGNLDEVGATVLLLNCLSHFGIDLTRFTSARNRRP